MLVTAAACVGNALEVCIFPAAAALGGLQAALALAATATLAYSVVAAFLIPETKDKTPDQIYDQLCPQKPPPSHKINTFLSKLRLRKPPVCIEEGVTDKVKSDNQVVSVCAKEASQNKGCSDKSQFSEVTLQTVYNKETENSTL